MIYEKKKLLVRRILWGILLLLSILIPVSVDLVSREGFKILSDNAYINNYSEYYDSTSCEVEVTFNKEVDSGYLTVAFYDESGNLLAQDESSFSGEGKVGTATFYIDGKVNSYEILSFKTSSGISVFIFIPIGIIAFFFFIAALCLSCKQYQFNGRDIVVYAGYFHNYIKVDGVKFDEHNVLITFVSIRLSCSLDDYTNIDVTITLSNRIALKINNQLLAHSKPVTVKKIKPTKEKIRTGSRDLKE